MSANRARKLVEAGVWLRISGDQEGARRLFEQALKLDPSNVRARQLLQAPPSTPIPQQASASSSSASAPPPNPFVRGEGPSRSVGLEVDWGLAAILPESQAALRAPAQPESRRGVKAAAPELALAAASAQPASVEPPPWAPGRSSPGLHLGTHPFQARDTQLHSLLQRATRLLGSGDDLEALEVIQQAQKIAPEHPEVGSLLERAEVKLLSVLETKLGNLQSAPRLLLKADEILWLNLDHRSGFVLAQIDGTVTFEDLFAVSGMTRLDTARILAQLKDQGVIASG
jgi:tetratricopeptide (TPR) repeat protein